MWVFKKCKFYGLLILLLRYFTYRSIWCYEKILGLSFYKQNSIEFFINLLQYVSATHGFEQSRLEKFRGNAKLLFCALLIVNIFILLINSTYFFFINFFIYGRKRALCGRSPRTPSKTPLDLSSESATDCRHVYWMIWSQLSIDYL